MAVTMLNKMLLFGGFVSLIHAAYSAAQHRTYLRLTEQESGVLPIDVIFQAVASLVLVIYAILQIVVEFKEIRAAVDLENKSWENLSNNPSFYTFNHRGKALSPQYDCPSAKPVKAGREKRE